MSNKYEHQFLEAASTLDALSNSQGEISTLANKIVSDLEDADIMTFLSMIYQLAERQKTTEIQKLVQLLKERLVQYYGYRALTKIYDRELMVKEDSRSLEELLDDLDQLIGLNNVKEEVNRLIAYQKVQKLRREKGLYAQKNTMHLAFLGNPGTGKTTVARIIGRIYKQLGLLSKGHFIEVSRTDLIAGYQGQTALKVKEIIEKSLGGVLFIDEAYSLTENDSADSYGKEALTELTKALEDYREDLVVIVAGYTDLMEQFFQSNPGLKSRFNTFLTFDDYTVNELEKIFLKICKTNDYTVEEDALKNIRSVISDEKENNDEDFANGRFVRNLYDTFVMNHAKRIMSIENPTIDQLSTLTVEDCQISN